MAGKMNYPTHGKGRKDDASWAASHVHWDMGSHSLWGGGETPSLQILGAHLADVRLQAALTLSVWSRRMRRALQRSLLAEGMRSSRGGAWNEGGGGEGGAGMDVLLFSAGKSPKVCLNNKLAFN